jgi:transposase-like protein
MSDAALQNPIFTDENAAREALEAARWPNGPICPHCGSVERIAKVNGIKKTHRPGLYYCNECKGQFTVTVGSVFERSKVPLTKWWLASYLHMAGKRGVPSHQIHRTLGVTYKTAWFMMHRIREAERDGGAFGPLGGKNKVVEIDESYVGGKEANKHAIKRTPGRQGGAGKAPILSLVERGGKVRSFHVPNVTAKTLKPIIVSYVNKATYLMTDESTVYPAIGREFAGHGSVNHSAEEYVRAYFWHTNTVENFFSIFKRGIVGTYYHVSEAHLHRYAAEFDFRYNHRSALGYSDMDRTEAMMRQIGGKRLTYRRTRRAEEAEKAIPF